MAPHRLTALIGSAAAVCLALTGCGVAGIGTASGAGGSNGPATGVSTNGAQEVAAPTALRVVPTGSLGRIVVDSSGRTLYRYDKDTARPPASTCDGTCARLWPPVRWRPGLKITGIRRARVGRVERADGTWQLTLSGRPLYRYAKDTAPGDVRGQGAGGSWFATTPAGAKARAPQGAPADGPVTGKPAAPPMPGMAPDY